MRPVILMTIFYSVFCYGELVEYPLEISLKDVAKTVSKQNFEIQSEAARVYQAKESIASARGDLIPSLNIWKIASAVAEGMTLVGVVGVIRDMAPFLVPNNWLRARQNEILYKAKREAYRALWGNEILTAKSIFIRSSFDHLILDYVVDQRSQFESLLEIAKARVALGLVPIKFVEDIQIWILDLKEDERALQLLIDEELNQISFLLGLPVEQKIKLSSIHLPDLKNEKPLDYDTFLFRVVDTAAELRQYEHLIAVVPLIKKEMRWSFLGSSEISRGTAGGVFERIPVSPGLGFGTGPRVRIVKGTEQILHAQKKGIEETIKRQLAITIRTSNLNLNTYKNATNRLLLTQQRKENLEYRLRLGDRSVSLEDIADSIKDISLSKIKILQSKMAHLIFRDRLERLIWANDYSKTPIEIEETRKVGQK